MFLTAFGVACSETKKAVKSGVRLNACILQSQAGIFRSSFRYFLICSVAISVKEILSLGTIKVPCIIAFEASKEVRHEVQLSTSIRRKITEPSPDFQAKNGINATVAQLVEQRIRNAQAVGSSPTISSKACVCVT